MQHRLTSLGYEVIIAAGAMEGLGIAHIANPDLILLDAILPGMDAAETCLCFRKISAVPIMLLTMPGSSAEVIKALTMGADAYMVKPVPQGELGARLKALLRRARRYGEVH